MFKFKKMIALSVMFGACFLYADVNPTWGYDANDGPSKWGNLDPSYKLCKDGKQQTPIDIITKNTKKTKNNIKFNYSDNTKDIINNGHSVQINESDGSSVTFNDVDYNLVQFHFHSHSENKINGHTFPLELHLVHKSSDGKLLVVSVLFKQGKKNEALQKIIDNLPKSVNETNDFKGFDIASLLPKDKGYYEFMGSLTTPPCSENVQWIVMKKHPEISKEQIKAMKDILHSDARNIQPLNGRVIKSTQD